MNIDTATLDIAYPNLRPELSKEILRRLDEKMPSKPITESMRLLTNSGGWNPSDLKYLRHVTREQFFEWLQTEASPDLIGMIREFFQRFGKGDNQSAEICSRLREALERIGKRSKLDALRLNRCDPPVVGSSGEK